MLRELIDNAALLNEEQSKRLFGVDAGAGAVEVQTESITSARTVWRNAHFQTTRTANRDNGDSLLEVARRISALPTTTTVSGHADRYGGNGVGSNGGSGRALVYKDVLLKGSGSTPLIGGNADLGHSSGGAYLEEAVRETIFCSIFENECPGSVLPILGIIDCGEITFWPKSGMPSGERNVLIVRPSVLRMGHFDRARFFKHSDPVFAGFEDAVRVKNVCDVALGDSDLIDVQRFFEQGLTNVIEQLAFGSVFGVQHNSLTSSNLTAVGGLLDFGASSAFPGWGAFHSATNEHSSVFSLLRVQWIFRSLAESITRYSSFPIYDFIVSITELDTLWSVLREKMISEMFYAIGFDDLSLKNMETGVRIEIAKILEEKYIELTNAGSKYFDYSEMASGSGFPLSSFWEANRSEVDKIGRILHESSGIELPMIAYRAEFMNQRRPTLYRERLKSRLHRTLSYLGAPSSIVSEISLTRLIAQEVVDGRRLCRTLPQNLAPYGYAVAEGLMLVVISQPDPAAASSCDVFVERVSASMSKRFPLNSVHKIRKDRKGFFRFEDGQEIIAISCTER